MGSATWATRRSSDNLRQQMRMYGPDDEAFAKSLARDLIQLASKEPANV